VSARASGTPGAAATYIYCVAQGRESPDSAGAPSGLEGTGPLRVLFLDDGLWLVAADAPLPDYSGEAIEGRLSDLAWVSGRALAHEKVVEHFAAVHPVLPMKLFTLFASDERAHAALSERKDEITRALARIAGRAEWGVRVIFVETKARQAATRAAAAQGETATGRGFLERKKAEQDGARTLVSRVRSEVDEAYADLAGHADAARRREPEAATGARLLLDAAFLVRHGAEAPFEQAVRRWANRLAASSCEVTLTGPWPPYNFIQETT
jgi:Gas vesicle synthesis protein GvpL/GvpF